MTDSSARALTHAALHDLQEALVTAQQPEDFLAHATHIATQPTNLLALPFETGTPEPLDAGRSGARGRDLDNAPRVYEYIGPIDRANAADGRLWSYLAFVTYRDYMDARWPLEGDGWKSRVNDRWLLTRSTRGSLIRHGISRLWWIADLTFDARLEYPLAAATGDSFAYTRAVLGNEDRVLGLFDREAGAVPAVVRGVLEHVEADSARGADAYTRNLMKEVTLTYGYRDLMVMDDEQVRMVIEEAAGL